MGSLESVEGEEEREEAEYAEDLNQIISTKNPASELTPTGFYRNGFTRNHYIIQSTKIYYELIFYLTKLVIYKGEIGLLNTGI